MNGGIINIMKTSIIKIIHIYIYIYIYIYVYKKWLSQCKVYFMLFVIIHSTDPGRISRGHQYVRMYSVPPNTSTVT